jgi:hypothetical protein
MFLRFFLFLLHDAILLPVELSKQAGDEKWNGKKRKKEDFILSFFW